MWNQIEDTAQKVLHLVAHKFHNSSSATLRYFLIFLFLFIYLFIYFFFFFDLDFTDHMLKDFESWCAFYWSPKLGFKRAIPWAHPEKKSEEFRIWDNVNSIFSILEVLILMLWEPPSSFELIFFVQFLFWVSSWSHKDCFSATYALEEKNLTCCLRPSRTNSFLSFSKFLGLLFAWLFNWADLLAVCPLSIIPAIVLWWVSKNRSFAKHGILWA